MKIVFIDNKPVYQMNTDIQRRICEERGFEYITLDCADEAEVIDKCQDADAILVVYTKITASIINSLPKCKVIIRFGIGYDVIDVAAATKKGIFVCNIPDYCIEEVATHTVAMLLDISRKVTFYNNDVKAGRWVVADGYTLHRLSNQTIGFVGFGNIARQAARYMAAFGSNIIAYDPFLPEEVFESNHVTQVDFDTLLSQSDIISLHLPLFDNTYHIIDKAAIAKMKDGAKLVNTSRGPLICEDALLEAVNSGKLTAAALDVVEFEPLTEANYRLFESGRIVVSPHAAFSSEESMDDMLEKIALTACQILSNDFNETAVKRIVNRKELIDQIKPAS